MRKLKQLGYDPEVGFPQDMALIPPAERGSLQDLSSEMRIDLMLKTNVAMARNYGRVVAGNLPGALFQFPAWQLVRLGVRQTPRGTPDSHTVGWQKRWMAAGASVGWIGAIESTLMVALKDSPIWLALGEGQGGDWRDTLGNPYPPFAFNSGMDWKAVPRAEWIQLSSIVNLRASSWSSPGSDRALPSSSAPMKSALAPSSSEIKARFDALSPDLQAALKARWAT
jgi:hypothetical protein